MKEKLLTTCPLCGEVLKAGYCNSCGSHMKADREVEECGCASPIPQKASSAKQISRPASSRQYQGPSSGRQRAEKKKKSGKFLVLVVVLIIIANVLNNVLPAAIDSFGDLFSIALLEEKPLEDVSITVQAVAEDAPLPEPFSLSGKDVLAELYRDPYSYIGQPVSFGGQVISTAYDVGEGYYAFDMWCGFDYVQSATVLVQGYPTVEYDEVVYVSGTVNDVISYEDESEEGQVRYCPIIAAEVFQPVDYTELYPAETVLLTEDAFLEQGGYFVFIEKIELCEEETRIHVTKLNQGNDPFYLDEFSFSLYADDVYLSESPYIYGILPELMPETVPGSSASAVLRYDPIPQGTSCLEITADGYYGDNYSSLGTYSFMIELD